MRFGSFTVSGAAVPCLDLRARSPAVTPYQRVQNFVVFVAVLAAGLRKLSFLARDGFGVHVSRTWLSMRELDCVRARASVLRAGAERCVLIFLRVGAHDTSHVRACSRRSHLTQTRARCVPHTAGWEHARVQCARVRACERRKPWKRANGRARLRTCARARARHTPAPQPRTNARTHTLKTHAHLKDARKRLHARTTSG
eukprot:1948498-Pleurochrysis_carterae.AAC.1